MTTRLEVPVLAQFLAEPIVRKREDQCAWKSHIAGVGGHGDPPLNNDMVLINDGLAEAQLEVALVLRRSRPVFGDSFAR
jgi:hypothetical protein